MDEKEKNVATVIANDIKSKIKEICSTFSSKLPNNEIALLALPNYAEKIIKTYKIFDQHTEMELKNINIIWDGFYSIFEDTCGIANAGREIRNFGEQLNQMIIQYLVHLMSNVNHDRSLDSMSWVYAWLTSLDYTKIDSSELTTSCKNTLFRVQKTINNVVNDIMATCIGNDISTANVINVYRDTDIVDYILEIYADKCDQYPKLADVTNNTPFCYITLEANINRFLDIAFGRKDW